MDKINALKEATQQLAVDVAELANAQRELENWKYQDQHRKDGSGTQDERHERMGRQAEDRVWNAKQKVNSQNALIATLTSAIRKIP